MKTLEELKQELEDTEAAFDAAVAGLDAARSAMADWDIAWDIAWGDAWRAWDAAITAYHKKLKEVNV